MAAADFLMKFCATMEAQSIYLEKGKNMNGFGIASHGEETETGLMEKMTLAKALRYIKRVKATVAKIDSHIKVSNSVIEGNKRDWDVEVELDSRRKCIAHLLELKLAIQEATRPIMRDILEISELKGEIVLLSSLDTRSGLVQGGYPRSDTPVKYEAYLTAVHVEHKTSQLQDAIDTLQAKIDHHNHTTFVQVNKPQTNSKQEEPSS